VLDLARCSSLRAGVVVADSALRKKRTTKRELQVAVESCRRWPGLQRAAEVVRFADGMAESPLESISRLAFRDCGLPPPTLQAQLGADGLVIARVDFYWEQFRTIAEADGEMKYDNQARRAQQARSRLTPPGLARGRPAPEDGRVSLSRVQRLDLGGEVPGHEGALHLE
jgi:hypothetical protein